MTVKNAAWLLALVCGISLAVAYGTPHLKASSCVALTTEYLQRNPIHGRSLDGALVGANPAEISAQVNGAFQVVTSYSTPRDLHADVHSHQCTTLPWRISLGPRKTVSLL
jgi:hypothetical protein